MKKAISILLVLFLFAAVSYAQLTTFTYPTNAGEAFLSDKYDVFVKVGNGTEQKLQVLMSDVNYRTMYDGDWMKNENKDRTFSFVHLDYDKAASGLTFRIVKKFGTNSSSAVISPKSYGYTANMIAGKELNFKMNDNQKYISINFVGSDNQSPTKGWIKNMLCIFVDPPETNKPNKTGAGVVVYSKTASASALSSATTIYFPAGYHNLREYSNGGLITADGQITIKSGQSLYLEGGAFLEGIVKRTAYQDVNQKIYGRGIITGRQYYWKNHPSFSGIEYGQLLEIGNNAEVSGIMYMESPNHGLVGRAVHVKNVKFLGWHSNHDGIRTGEGSEIEHTFARAVDDHFYNFNIWVHDCVLWAGHNGAIMTYGWSGEAGSNNYNAGASIMENVDIINCEWTSLGNNNGLIMSQRGYDYKPFGYGGSATTIMRNIRMEGSIPGLTNLKPRSSGTANIAVQIPDAQVGYLGDLILENITVEDQFGKGVIRGEADPSADGNAKWLVKNVQFTNVSIGGICVNETNKAQFFTIDATTIQNVTFSCFTVNQKPVVSFTTPANNATFSAGSDVNVKVNATDADGTISLVKLYLNDILMSRQLTTSPYEWALIGLTNDVRLRKMNPGTYALKTVAYDNAGDSTIAIRSFTISAITGLEESVAILESKLFPNPSNSVFYIEQKGLFQYEILDLAGKTIEKGEAENKTTIGQNIEAGIYFILISKEQNSFKLKIVKQ